MHKGVDFGAPTGTPVIAASDGKVERAGWAGGYGRFIKLDHADGWATGYGHLSAWGAGVKPGASVRQGQVIGYVGASGLATGPHLHYEIYRSGVAVDPGGVTGAVGRGRLATPSPQLVAERRWIASLLVRESVTNGGRAPSGVGVRAGGL